MTARKHSNSARFWTLASDKRHIARLDAMTAAEWEPWEDECRREWARKSRDGTLAPSLMIFNARGIVDEERAARRRIPPEWRDRVAYIETEGPPRGGHARRPNMEHVVRLWVRGTMAEVPDVLEPCDVAD